MVTISADVVRGMLIDSIHSVFMEQSYQPCKFMTSAMNAMEPRLKCVAFDIGDSFRLMLRFDDLCVCGDYKKPYQWELFMFLFDELVGRIGRMFDAKLEAKKQAVSGR